MHARRTPNAVYGHTHLHNLTVLSSYIFFKELKRSLGVNNVKYLIKIYRLVVSMTYRIKLDIVVRMDLPIGVRYSPIAQDTVDVQEKECYVVPEGSFRAPQNVLLYNLYFILNSLS